MLKWNFKKNKNITNNYLITSRANNSQARNTISAAITFYFTVPLLNNVSLSEDTKNWAWQMVASQSSTTLNMTADLAVDGNYNCTVGASFSHTHEHDLHPWWIVDLKQTLTVTEVVVYTPDSYGGA